MMKKKSIKFLPLIISIVFTGCYVAPGLGYYSSRPVGKGNVRFGLGGGIGALTKEMDTPAVLLDGFVDLGTSCIGDLRLRLNGLLGGLKKNEAFWMIAMPGIEYKHTGHTGHVAFLTGLYPSFEITKDSVDFYSIAPMMGAVFGIDLKRSIQITIVPRVAVGMWLYGISTQGIVGVGLDLPFSDDFSLRPEISGACTWLPADDSHLCMVGLGIAMII